MKKNRRVILGVTGSIAAYKACEITGLLRKAGLEVQVLLTEEAKEFVTPLTLQTLSGNRVITDMFDSPEEWDPVHTSLADSASIVLIAPATANIIGKLACGICDDILSCVVMATRAPVLIAPAMNDKMYTHGIVQENIAKLKRTGYKFVGPVKGRLACGYEGMGCLADAQAIASEVKRLLK